MMNGTGAAFNSDGSVGSGGLKRPGITDSTYILAGGNAPSTQSVTQFAWPLGSNLGNGHWPTVMEEMQMLLRIHPTGLRWC